MKPRADYSLYLVTDQDCIRGRNLIDVVEAAIRGGVTIVQLREKNLSSLEFYNVALELKKLTAFYHIPLIINDRVDIAMAVDADGVHVGQKDLPALEARRLIGPTKILGVSTATLEEALRAQSDGADYIGAGALFSTSTKSNTRKVSLEQIEYIQRAVKLPVVGIGGISEDNIGEVGLTGVAGAAVASAILKSDDIENATRNIKIKFKNR